MKRICLLALFITLSLLRPVWAADADKIVGPWRLVSYEVEVQSSGEKMLPMGKAPSGYVIFTPEMLRHLIAQVGASQVVVGTDHPIPWQEKSVDHILGTPGLSNAQKMAILGGTAAKLLGIKA